MFHILQQPSFSLSFLSLFPSLHILALPTEERNEKIERLEGTHVLLHTCSLQWGWQMMSGANVSLNE